MALHWRGSGGCLNGLDRMDDVLDVLNEAPCGFLSFGEDGTIRRVNETLLILLGYERSAVEGQPLGLLLSVAGRVFCQTHLFPLLKLQGKAEEIYLSLRSQEGVDVPVLINAAQRERNQAIWNDCVLIPMRQRTRYEDELIRARKAAEEAVRERERTYAALAQAHKELEKANVELEAQQEERQAQQEQLLVLNSRLHARAEREALLNRIGQVLRASGEPEAVLGAAVALLGEALTADRCYFAEYDMTRDWARVSADWHQSSLTSLQGTYHISEFDLDIAEIYGPRGLLIAGDIWEVKPADHKVFSAKAVAALGAIGMRSWMGVALFEDEIPVASLNVAMAETPRVWTEDEAALVQSVATLIRLVVEEVRLRDRERRIAEQLQAALQPSLPDNVAGLHLDACYRPALREASVGGDFYDVFLLEEGCCALIVADLSGKGLKAAAQVATVRHMLRAHLYEPGVTIVQSITQLNQMITQHDLLVGFATLFVGAYNVAQRTLTYVNAGQDPALLRQASTREIIRLEPSGPVLGGFSGATFEERIVPLASGDVLALFTDGLTEAGRTRRKLLEIDGVAQIFASCTEDPTASVEEITARIMTGVELAVTPAGIRDDVCLLVAQVR
jgi:serine phosphatase RsbU (regulator of sigma subunit)